MFPNRTGIYKPLHSIKKAPIQEQVISSLHSYFRETSTPTKEWKTLESDTSTDDVIFTRYSIR
jgi:hypothetical protein